jgi:hypothetical protein
MSLPNGLITGRTANMPGDYKPQPARGRTRHEPGKMNKAEALYALELEARQRAGEILWFGFEPVKFRLADRTFYSPDFMVQLADGTIEFHEVKGWMEDDAAVKWRVVREMYPMFGWKLITKRGAR